MNSKLFCRFNSLMMAAFFILNGLVARAEKTCEELFNQNQIFKIPDVLEKRVSEEKKFISQEMGIELTGKALSPLRIRVVSSKYSTVENSVNNVANRILSKPLQLDRLNEVAKIFLNDLSADPYWIRLNRAFTYKLQFNQELFRKSIPAEGPVLVLLNHPRNGSDGIAAAAALSHFRSGVKVVMTEFLRGAPGMAEHAIFVNPYGGERARRTNQLALVEMRQHLEGGGVLVMFAGGDVSLKNPFGDGPPLDGPWKTGAYRLLEQVPDAQVLSMHMGGEASTQFYEIRSKGLGIKTSVAHVRELTNNQNKEFPMGISAPIAARELLEANSYQPEKTMQFLRARSYLHSEQFLSLKGTYQSARTFLAEVAEEYPKQFVFDLVRNSHAELLVSDERKNIQVFLISPAEMRNLSPLLHNIAVKRERVFRSVGEGTGLEKDTDSFDQSYYHLVAFDSENYDILGGTRFIKVSEILNAKSDLEGALYTASFFDHGSLIRKHGKQLLEISRSFVDTSLGSRSLFVLDRIWKAKAQFILRNPEVRYLMGSLSISGQYSPIAQNLMMRYLLHQAKHDEFYLNVKAKVADFEPHYLTPEIQLVAEQIKDLKELNRMIVHLESLPIPSLIHSYGKLGVRYLAFTRDLDFNSLDGLILVDLASENAYNEALNIFGEKYKDYLKFHQ